MVLSLTSIVIAVISWFKAKRANVNKLRSNYSIEFDVIGPVYKEYNRRGNQNDEKDDDSSI